MEFNSALEFKISSQPCNSSATGLNCYDFLVKQRRKTRKAIVSRIILFYNETTTSKHPDMLSCLMDSSQEKS